MEIATALALGRFGLGRRGTEATPTDPHEWLRVQLSAPDPAANMPAPDLSAALRALRADRKAKLAASLSENRNNFRRDSFATFNWAVITPAPFRERLVWFWANHFTVSSRRPQCEGLIGPFVAGAIRPHVTGRFGDMLLAVVRHPAMLIYLDNVGSIGPASQTGRSGKHGLNENLGRECLELHTVTPASGYTQTDVTNFARMLTGWSVDFNSGNYGFEFRPAAHEPGSLTLMGRNFPPGEQGGIDALAFLADHPGTHHNLATKLVRHFVADDPPADDVRRIEGVLRDTRGDLGAATQALIELVSAWRPYTKLRSPMDFSVAVLRALDPPSIPLQSIGALRLLGQPLWSAPQPDGWPDRAADWATPEAMLRRVDFAYAVAGRDGTQADPVTLAEAALGPLLRPATQDAIHRAGSRREAVALLFASPEFQRR